MMDKLSIISGALFLAADVFAIASLCMPNWIVSSVSGKSWAVSGKMRVASYESASCELRCEPARDWSDILDRLAVYLARPHSRTAGIFLTETK